MGEWANAFSGIGSKLYDTASGGISSAFDWLGKNKDGIAGLGTLTGGLGTVYGAYNSDKLTDASIDSTNLQNKLYMDKYNEDKKDKESLNNSFASVWGK